MRKYTLIRFWRRFIQWCQGNGMMLDGSCQALVTHRYQSAFYRMDPVYRGRWLQNVLIGDCSTQWMLSSSLSTKYLDSSPVLVPTDYFFPTSSVFFFFHVPHVMPFCFCTIVSTSSFLSPLHLSLMLNVIPPFFRLWFRWHLPRVAVNAKCRLGRWDIGQPLPFPSFHPSLSPSLLFGMTITQFVLNACWVLQPVDMFICKM